MATDLQEKLEEMLATVPAALDLAAGVIVDAAAHDLQPAPETIVRMRRALAKLDHVLAQADLPTRSQPGEIGRAIDVARDIVGTMTGAAVFWKSITTSIERLTPAERAAELEACPDAPQLYHRLAAALRDLACGIDATRRALTRGTATPSPSSPTPDAGNPPGGAA